MRHLHLLLALFFVLGLKIDSIAQEFLPPELEFACELRVTIDQPHLLGATPFGDRVIIPISGGTFEGPKMKGTILDGGADYQYSNKELGRTRLEAIYTIKTDDGIFIHVRNVGLICMGEKKDGQQTPSFYFRAAPTFEAPIDSKYNWLNNAIFICNAEGKNGYISIQVWKVL